MASDLVGFKARQLIENHWNRSASANSSVLRSAVRSNNAEDEEHYDE